MIKHQVSEFELARIDFCLIMFDGPPSYGVLFVKSILLLIEVTFIDKSNFCPKKLLLSDKSNFC